MIGIFDSGVGGLSVLNQLHRLIPDESLLYVADTKNLPYGGKTEAFLQKRSLEISDFLVSKGARLIVIACNTATAASVELVREHLGIPIVAVEPPLKPAVAISKSGVIGILATEVTIKSRRFRNLVEKYAEDFELIERPSNDLVPLVENHTLGTQQGRKILSDLVDQFLARGVDAVVLGSTHFSFLKNALIELSGGKLFPMCSAEATAQQVLKVAMQTEKIVEDTASTKIMVSGDVNTFAENLKFFSNIEADVSECPV